MQYKTDRFYYDSYQGRRYITLNRGSAEWFNADCPDIKYADGSTLFSSNLNGVYVDVWDMTLEKYEKLEKFIRNSHLAACKKYDWEVTDLLLLKKLADIKGKTLWRTT